MFAFILELKIEKGILIWKFPVTRAICSNALLAHTHSQGAVSLNARQHLAAPVCANAADLAWPSPDPQFTVVRF